MQQPFEDEVLATFTLEKGGSRKKILTHHLQLGKKTNYALVAEIIVWGLLDFTNHALC